MWNSLTLVLQISFFSFSVYQRFNTQNVHYDGHVFLCKMDRTKIKHTNQLKIAQNEIRTPRKFPAIRYTTTTSLDSDLLLAFVCI